MVRLFIWIPLPWGSCYHKQEGKFLSNQLSRPYPLLLWVASSCQSPYVMRLKPLSENSGGDKGVTGGKFIGWDGRKCAGIKIREEWVLRILLFLTMQCWQNSHGDCFMTKTHFSIECLRLDSFQMAQFWMPKILHLPLMLGRAF